jgi:hypothetical protein
MVIWFCDRDVNCPRKWEELKTTDNPLVRDCSDCGKPVQFIDTEEELRNAAELGKCVAFYKYSAEEIPLQTRFELRRLYVSTRPVRDGFMTLGLPSKGRNSGSRLQSFIDSFSDDAKNTQQ